MFNSLGQDSIQRLSPTSDKRPFARLASVDPPLSRQLSAEQTGVSTETGPGTVSNPHLREQMERDAHELSFIHSRLEQVDALARHARHSSYALSTAHHQSSFETLFLSLS